MKPGGLIIMNCTLPMAPEASVMAPGQLFMAPGPVSPELEESFASTLRPTVPPGTDQNAPCVLTRVLLIKSALPKAATPLKGDGARFSEMCVLINPVTPEPRLIHQKSRSTNKTTSEGNP